MRVVVSSALASAAIYAILAGAGDLRAHAALYLAGHALLLALMLVAWRALAAGSPLAFRVMLAAAVAFRLIAAVGPPSLSDDIYRYVWDGRVQAAFHHPYKFAPADPARSEMRDADVYPRINHPELKTIYPPLAEMLFAALSLARLGVTGFKVAFALIDVAVIWALLALLRALRLPRDRVVLYAWNPLAVIEIAGSGHVEPLGILFLTLALACVVEGKAVRAGAFLGGAIQAKLLPLLLVPGFARRMKAPALLTMLAVVSITTAPYALRGPWFGGGVVAYAHRWEHGAVLFAGVREFLDWVDAEPHLKLVIAWAQGRCGSGQSGIWDALYRMAWPEELARVAVLALALLWAAAQSFRPRPDAAHEARLALGGALLLAPTLHPWYVLWVLPIAAVQAAGGWLLFGALVPLQYLAGVGDVPWSIRLLILVPSLAWMIRDALVGSRR
jgi:hypothetical protein